jgi:hypothetical protein
MLKRIVRFFGTWKSGKPQFDNRPIFDAWATSNKDGERFECSWSKESEDITSNQRGYYHGQVIPFAAKQLEGWTELEVEGMLKKRFLTVNGGTEKEYVRSETTLNKEEYTKLIDETLLFLATQGIVVPPPSKSWR